MAQAYEFAIVRLISNDARDERLNVGIAIVNGDRLDIRVSKRLDKIHAMTAALDSTQVCEHLANVQNLDRKLRDAGNDDLQRRLAMLFGTGPISLSAFGNFVARDANDYEGRATSLLQSMVDPEPRPRSIREKRSKLLTQVKSAFRRERVLAETGEDLQSHRLVPQFEIAEGLTADLALKNGAMHVIATVDASSDNESARKAIADIGVAALVLERGRMQFGPNDTCARLVYTASASLERVARLGLDAVANQGAELINWASIDDRNRFVDSLASLATPLPRKRRRLGNKIEFGRDRTPVGH